MSTTTKLLGFVVVVVAVLAAAVGVGKLVGPADAPEAADHESMDEGHEETGEAHGTSSDEAASTAVDVPKGLMVSQNGYTLELGRTDAPAGSAVPIEFTIVGPAGEPVTDYDVEHEKELHLIAVRRDFSGFQHVHPVMDAEGTWRTDLDLTAGEWRVFADFKASGADALTLGHDLAVAGSYRPERSTESTTSQVGRYTVTLEGDLTAGTDAELTLSVTLDGEPVTDLEPYLGAYGHLVALRAGDLAYLHVHPEGTPDDGTTEPGPDVVFYAQVPSAGRYHLYLDFKHRGVVRTAAFTVTGTSTSEPVDSEEPEESDESDESEEPHSEGH
jgi:hypothetical protein